VKLLVLCTTGGSGRRQFGGVEHLLIDLLPAMRERGVDVTAATPADAVGTALRDAGVPWVELGARKRIDMTYKRKISELVREQRPDVVGAHLLSAAMHARAALGLRDRRTPLVVSLHNSLWQYRETAPTTAARASVQANIAVDLALRRLRPHMSVAVSAYEERELRERGHVKRVRLIPNPLPRGWPEPGSQLGPHRTNGRIGYLGRLEREKGADLLTGLAKHFPDTEFAVAGNGSVPVEGPNVKLYGHVDPAAFLPTLDCLVVPSRVESFGKSALQAISLGVPVVHTGVGGLDEVTRRADGVLAFTSAALADGVRTALAAGAGGRLEVAREYRREYGFEQCLDTWIDLYGSVADGRS
jgi:glycosyltransferase involved in cell wall biosynthesis